MPGRRALLGSENQRRHALFFLFFALLVPALAFLTACGSSSSSTSSPTISASCVATANTGTQVVVGQTATCTASITNLSSTVANWSVTGTGTGTGSNPYGTITSSGTTATYTAPATIPVSGTATENVITVTATAQAQSSLSTTTTLTLEPDTTITTITCLDAAQNTATTVASGETLNCTATNTTSPSTPLKVNWTINGMAPPVNPTVGTLTTQGSYTAPLVPPAGGSITLTATSQALSTNHKSITITDVFGNNVLQNTYVFSTSGRVTNANTFFARIGSLSAGGGVLSGLEDTNQTGDPPGPAPSTTVGTTQIPFTGSYSIDRYGRGTMQFCENTSQSCPPGSVAATAFFRIVVASPQQVEMIDFSSSTTSTGEMIVQDPSVVGARDGNLSGAYSFSFAGVSSAGTEESVVGDFSANGFGTISAGSTSPPSPGEMDVNGALQSLGGSTYSILSNARGEVKLNGLTFSFYVVSAGRSKFLEIDPSSPSASSILIGDAYKQQTGGAICGWSQTALSGSAVIATSGSSSSVGTALAGLGSFMASSGSLSNISLDENNGGTYTPPGTLTGSYAVDESPQPQPGCGRGTLTIGTHSYVFYLISGSSGLSAVLQETTAGVVARGSLVQVPAALSFANSSLSGSYALQLSGTDAPGTAGKRQDTLGQLTADGNGNVVTNGTSSGVADGGFLDLNDYGATQTGVAINKGSYGPASTGILRGTLQLNTGSSNSLSNYVLYLVSSSQSYILETDATGVVFGSLYLQF